MSYLIRDLLNISGERLVIHSLRLESKAESLILLFSQIFTVFCLLYVTEIKLYYYKKGGLILYNDQLVVIFSFFLLRKEDTTNPYYWHTIYILYRPPINLFNIIHMSRAIHEKHWTQVLAVDCWKNGGWYK